MKHQSNDESRTCAKQNNPVGAIARITLAAAKKIIFFVVGVTIILIGAILLFLPGPGILLIFIGTAILGAEFVWARMWIQRIKQGFDFLSGQQKKRKKE